MDVRPPEVTGTGEARGTAGRVMRAPGVHDASAIERLLKRCRMVAMCHERPKGVGARGGRYRGDLSPAG